MRLRQFTVPFSTVVGEEATELEFGPDDYLVVRPLFGLSRDEIGQWQDRMEQCAAASREAMAKPAKRAAAEEANDRLIIDMIARAVVEWHLDGPEGPIPQPSTPEALGKLPAGIAGALFGFLSNYRGENPNPTTPQ